MTVHRGNEETRENCFPSVSPSAKNHWPAMENDSSSWDRNSRATSSSWPGEMEESATRKILQYWHAIEKNIYGEADEASAAAGLSSEECGQWRSQLIHLRLVGKGASCSSNRDSVETSRSDNQRFGATDDRYAEEVFVEDNLDRAEDCSDKSRRRRLAEEQKNVLDRIFDRVCTELAKKNDEIRAPSSKDLEEVLRITPAPSYSGKRWKNDRKERENGDCRKSCAKTDRSGFEKSGDGNDVAESRSEDDVGRADETDTPPVTRNKLGTVFNEKIVVSPVPFAVSTRESFTTLRMTPISFRAHNFKISSSEGMGRYMSSASTTNSGNRIAPSRISQIHSAWQAPVCPAVWPKNIKLAPIDPARLPSSKNRMLCYDYCYEPENFGSTITMIDPDTPIWIQRLSRQPNLVRTGIPYIPMLLKNIEPYTNLDDFTEDRVKTVETIGILRPIDVRTASLISTTENPECTIKLAIEHLRTEYVYPKDAAGICGGLRNAWDTVKVFGALETRNEEVVLVVDHIVVVEDFVSCEKTLSLMAKLARTKYSLYEYDLINNRQLRNYIDKMGKGLKKIPINVESQ